MAAFLAALALASSPFKVTLTAPTHTPRVDVRWTYVVRAHDLAGKPLRARVTAQVVDPFGGVHPVEYGASTRKITNILFTGRFSDYVEWPSESRGFRLTFRVTVASGGKAVRLTYWVKPR